MHEKFSRLTRRQMAVGLGASLAVLSSPSRSRAEYAPEYDQGWRVLRARQGEARLRGANNPPTTILGYDGIAPGPPLRLKRGEELRVRLINELDDGTTVHWHGLRLPNAMDGVPHLTQLPVQSGASFDYRFTPPDAGTFWYHAHYLSSEQVGRGLYGPLIVDESDQVAVDHDVVLVLDDWRLNSDGRVAPFGGLHDAAHAGRLGNLLAVNGAPAFDLVVKTNERIRLRLINAANARVMPLRLVGHRANVMAIDGQPSEPFIARDGRLVLGPGNRIDVFFDATLSTGTNAPLVLFEDVERPLVRIVYDSSPGRSELRLDPVPLPDNPLPKRMDFAGALKRDVPIDGGAMAMMGSLMGGGGMMGRGPAAPSGSSIWALANRASDGHSGAPLFSVARGRTVMLAFTNRTAFPHAMHLHGHHFRLLDRLDDGWKPFWLDTIVVPPAEPVRIAFVADNPGKWMIHCHMLEHQESGMAAWFEVT
ncbi:MAG: multicopper oxidase family protein [Xanthobacteraceae bacterium]